MQPEIAYRSFFEHLMPEESLIFKQGEGGLSHYKHGLSICHFNARPRSGWEDLGFADFRYQELKL
jgi:hypothetical protein